jgi:hypothetical protein
LDHVVDLEAVRRLDLAAHRGDDPRGRGSVEAERLADGDDRVADADVVGVRERQWPKLAHAAGVDAEDGEV